MRRRLEVIIDELPPSQCMAIHLCFMEKMTQEDAGKEMGMTKQGVSYHLLRGLEQIRAMLYELNA
jgi:RNA polymerase sigma factor (sigma-70 family)